MNENESIIEILNEFLGEPKHVNDYQTQIQYNCPICDDGRKKGNLEVNIEEEVFHCWSCGDENGTHGVISKLFDMFGNKKLKKLYNLIKPEDKKPIKREKKALQYPEGYIKFSESNPRYPIHNEALNYLYRRGVTDEIINKYDIGYTALGKYMYRIIIPSYDSKNKLNYFIARAWGKTKFKYLNPDAEKDLIIFNENKIDWDKDIYIVEGVFDSIFIENSIPLLGKHLSELLFNTLYNKANGNIHICLDGDAYKDALLIYHTINGGRLYGKVVLYKFPKDKDVCDLKGDISRYKIIIL